MADRNERLFRAGRRAFLTAAGGGAVFASAALGQTAPPATGMPGPARLPDPAETIDLWPNGAPGMPATPPVETVVERGMGQSFADRAVSGIARPRMAVFRPERPNGAAVMIMPGGGYTRIVIDKEGYELGRWLSARGFTAFVLFYRLPGEGWAAGPDVSLSDAQRAMRLIRHRARTYGIDPARVAAMGFSAGGHLCADLLTRFAVRTYDPVDGADALSARPAAAAPVYPVVSMSAPDAHPGSREKLVGKDASPALERAHSPHLNVPADAPPVFLLHAEDDATVPVENAVLLRAALRAKGIPVETHLFARGGHGFGLRGTADKPVAAWPGLFVEWAKGLLIQPH
ncbi:alpha/beta hydrolase [Sphingomonas koreensis]|jgi:acetyl esterase/lipase|uniref:Alpha/beta hydrolase n=1 Tax=Sphingomonas koreensis TaxID=93064 RepID=A0AAJ4S0T2_9SPHN|nr:alpha/beta hydrolase [Sphingomonas koreensis]RSU22263.1 alpha/beta hydrolase [Sphingomonas koreensis]RSU29523.1 alpha/beta hydrolase [Sphingomonas koreensis]RSU29944.1 alpha/beta hydrolase [Sphingomonas koreensis]RSU33780.1 alpha/beta hydrolase [Sphingomonas koreensis]